MKALGEGKLVVDRYLRWAEPWGGCLLPEDTGLCNRLLHWEIAFHISQENDFAFKILVEQPFWAELSYLDIPITEGIEKKHMRDKDYVYDPATFIKGAKPITLDMIDWMFKNQDWKLSRDTDWFCDFGFNHVDEVQKFAKTSPTTNWWYPKDWREEFRPLKLIEFKNKNFQKLIEMKMKGVVGIHLRRHPNGVFRDVDDKYLLRNGEPIDWKTPKANGKIFGAGAGKSSMKYVLPQSTSDFIFAIIAEEYGIIVAFIILLLYIILFFRIIITSYKCETKFGQLVSIGVGIPVVFQAFTNMAVAVQLIPVTGQPLPLVSTGGTSIWITFLAVGILLSVSKNNLKYNAIDFNE